MSLLVATYNVHACVGTDGNADVARIAAVIDELQPDVIALQEVMTCDFRPLADQVSLLADRLGMQAISAGAFRRLDGHYGNALLSKLAIEHSRHVDISQSGREPRSALEVELRSRDRMFYVVNTHLGLRPIERNRQLDRLLRAEHGTREHPLVLVGDFNVWLPLSRVLRQLRKRFGDHPAPRSYPSDRPWLPLDRIWVEPHELLQDMGAHATPLSAVASDHLPVWARIDV